MIACSTLALVLSALSQTSLIRMNQVGFGSGEPKIAILLAPSDSARLVGPGGEVVWSGVPSAPRVWAEAGDTGRLVDFSSFRTPGTWRLVAANETSYPVVVSGAPWEGLVKGLVKGLWYNRCGYAIQGPEAGSWTRASGHPDTDVRIHPSAVGPNRTTASRIRAPGGWYDAGDYGKYLPSSAISTWSLFQLHQSFSSYFDTLAVGVPSHPGPSSDLLDEAIWNLRWMLSMQDPDDGGVYHRLTTLGFPGDQTMPASDRSARYVSPKSTAAALDLAATAAKAYRVLGPLSPALADSCLLAALQAWGWARRHPTDYFRPDSINENFPPAIDAGPYADEDVSDEFDWAAMELMLATGQDSFSVAIDLPARVRKSWRATLIDWGDVRGLGLLSLSLEAQRIPAGAATLASAADSMLVSMARSIRIRRATNGYHLPDAPFKWSSNTAFANNGVVCWNAWRITRDTSFRSSAIDLLDYLLGRNATDYSFVTGFGALTPQHPHHRISNGDGVAAPVPGMLVGGPNPGQEDACDGYPSTLAPKSYVDAACSYASNEPAINQNAALLLLAGSLSAEPTGSGASGVRRAAPLMPNFVTIRDGVLHVGLPSTGPLEVEVFDARGGTFASASGNAGATELPLARRGLWLIRARSGDRVWCARAFVP